MNKRQKNVEFKIKGLEQWFFIREPTVTVNKSVCTKLKKKTFGTDLVVQWFRLCAPSVEGVGSIPCLGTKMPHAVQCVMAKRPKKKKILPLNALKLLVHLSPPQLEFWKKELDFDPSLVSRIMSNTTGTESLLNESI